ncbi:MAG TPA: hypothetical protein PLD84_16645 [Chitinophagales bacterium]|nr:hypothetical protein [Chitinophagales bacterium]
MKLFLVTLFATVLIVNSSCNSNPNKDNMESDTVILREDTMMNQPEVTTPVTPVDSMHSDTMHKM